MHVSRQVQELIEREIKLLNYSLFVKWICMIMIGLSQRLRIMLCISVLHGLHVFMCIPLFVNYAACYEAFSPFVVQ